MVLYKVIRYSTHIALLLLFLFGTAFLFQGCKTTKNKWANRAYHGTTTRFNYYFNARESIRDGVDQYRNNYDDDYTQLLPVWTYPDEVTAKSLYPQMDVAIEKCQNAIELHSIYINKQNQEYNTWIDDSYFLIGKAYFFKREFADANRLLTYTAREYKHSETRFDAMLWLAKTKLEQGDYNETRKLIDILKDADEEARLKKKKPKRKKKKSKRKKSKTGKNKKPDLKTAPFPKRLRDDLFALEADMFIRQERYDDAIAPLDLAIENAKSKAFRTRLIYILAQIYQESGDKNNASLQYARVIKMHPNYEMEFYARINRALNVNVRSKDYNDIRTELKKMLKDEKNDQYYDQIYYALAEIELKDRNRDLAVEYLKKSVDASINNKRQKGLSFLKLAELQFDRRIYTDAQRFYDSTTQFLPEDHASFEMAEQRAEYLTDLVGHLNIIAFEDSVRALAAWDKNKLYDLIDDIIQEKKDAADALQTEEELNRLNNATVLKNPGVASKGGFWPYNATARGFGFNEFRKKWGDRKLEDNWRRSDRSASISDFDPQQEDAPENDDDEDLQANNEYSRDYYLKSIPTTDSALMASHNNVMEAIWGSGIIYKEKLNDNKQAIASFKSLIERYDTCRYQLPAYYQLYRLYLALGDHTNATLYKNKLSEFPDSEYWKVIVNPDFKKEDEKQRLTDKAGYEKTLDVFRQGFYSVVLNDCDNILASTDQNFYAPKYHLLRAQTLSQMDRIKEVAPTLREVVVGYPGSPEAIKAAEYLAVLTAREEQSKAEESPYKMDVNSEHFFVMVFPNTRGSVRHYVKKVADFNDTYFRNDGLKVENLIMDPENQIIVVKRFPDMQTAGDYYIAFKTNDNILKEINNFFDFYTLSRANYQTLYKEKDFEEYKKFFEANYLN